MSVKEIWKPIEGYENRYRVSNLGNIYSEMSKKILKSPVNSSGYRKVKLFDAKGSAKSYLVHRLVALTFIDNPEGKPQVNHIDGNKTNNHFNNLEWSTNGENMKHAYEIGLNPGCDRTGKNNGRVILSEQDVVIIRELRKEGKRLKELSNKFNVGISTIQYIVSRKTWKHIP